MSLTHWSHWITPLIIAAILALLALTVSRTPLHDVYNRQLGQRGQTRRERLFLASLGFFVAVAVVRALTFAIHNDIGPFHNVTLHGRHIHHLVWGILLLLLVGYLWLLEIGTGSDQSSRWVGRLTSMLFGVGAALTLDEFALWLNLEDVYWQRQGRESVEAMGLFGGLLGIGIFGGPFFREVAVQITRPFHHEVRR
ncbi:MAG: hypothetical protein JOY54_10660 [Acidobacteriaceae bacterium]|nr:hypothetical protein [Acidobacteriaceae bacterium]